MSKKASTEVAKKEEKNTGVAEVPDYLKGREAVGTDTMKAYQSSPMLAVVAPLSKPDIKDAFGEGSIYADGMLIAKFNQVFRVTPLFFWPSWQKHRHVDDKTGNFIMDESYDPNSDLATMSRNPDTRKEPYDTDPSKYYKYVESLNFAIWIHDGAENLNGSTAVVKFNRGGHGVGKRLCSYLNRTGLPIYANVIELQTIMQSNANHSWHQIAFNAPEDGNKYVAEDQIDEFEATYKSLNELYQARTLVMGQEGDAADKKNDE